MPPEEVAHVLAIDWATYDHDTLTGRSEQLWAYPDKKLSVSWYSEETPEGYIPICGGVAYAKTAEIKDGPSAGTFRLKATKGVFEWRNPREMSIIVLPPEISVTDPNPMPTEAKEFNGRLAVHWTTRKPSGAIDIPDVWWRLKKLDRSVKEEVERINYLIQKSKWGHGGPKYDVAFSYASENREYVAQVASAINATGDLRIYDYSDEEEKTESWGKDLYDHLSEVYGKLSRCTVLFYSSSYAAKRWTNLEASHAEARATATLENRRFILPVALDDTPLPEGLARRVFEKMVSPEELAHKIRRKVESIRI
jgi:hypothetical protein